MRSKSFLLICLAVPFVVFSAGMVLWAKEKCWWVCVGFASDLCPIKENPCVWMASQVPTVADECVHIWVNLNGAFPPIDHSIVFESGDRYKRQCVPCDVPEGQNEPQLMQWYELRIYACGVRCFGYFVTTK